MGVCLFVSRVTQKQQIFFYKIRWLCGTRILVVIKSRYVRIRVRVMLWFSVGRSIDTPRHLVYFIRRF